MPSDSYFLECILGTIYRWSKVCYAIQGSSWAGPIYLPSFSPQHTSLHPLFSSLGLWAYLFLLLVLRTQTHAGPKSFPPYPFPGSVGLCSDLLGEILFFLLLCLLIYYQSSSTECKLCEGLDLSHLPLSYPLYLQEYTSVQELPTHVRWLDG